MKAYLIYLKTFNPGLRNMLCAQALVGIGTGMFAVLLNLYLKDRGFTEDTIGQLLAVQSIAAAIASVPLGWLADRTSRRTAYLIGIILCATGYAWLTIVDRLLWMVGGVLVSGAGNGALLVAVQPFLQENSRRKQRPYLFSMNFCVTWLMGIVAGLLAGWIPRVLEELGMTASSSIEALRQTLRLAAGFMCFAFIPALLLPTDRPRTDSCPQNLNSPSAADNYSPHIVIAMFVVTSSLIGAGAGLIVPYFNLYFRDWVGASVAQIGTIFAIGQFATVIGAVSSPAITRRIGLVWGIVGTQLCSLPFMLLMAWRHDLLCCAGGFFFRMAFMNLGIPMREQMLMARLPQAWRARAAALDSTAWYLAWASSMLFSGNLLRQWGYDKSLYITFGLYLLSAALYYRFFRDQPAVSAAERKSPRPLIKPL
ncbi:MAG: MFS transporter [Candidatus Riflebacteria bacterium]|nr:MFS transporter [Candidatus Riflebacteria bacterium]